MKPTPLPLLLKKIRETHKENEDVMRARSRIELQCQATCRRFTKGSIPRAKALWIKLRKNPTTTAAGRYLKTLGLLDAYILLLSKEKGTRKRLEELVLLIPIMPWVESVSGLGLLSVGRMLGEIGNPCDYSGPSKIWKRMGLAVIFDPKTGKSERQRKCLNKELAVIHGYSPVRRSIMFIVADTLLKKKNPYKTLYDERKPYELNKLPERLEDGKKDKARKMKAHRRAARYAAKRLLLDLWLEWHKAVGVKAPGQPYQLAKAG